ncbi:hypothetical protein OG792_26065 [Micromonospora sp. NBC_01699]|uniref:hypothetical protein n=1 Tax=Micromonospora sp. NBC_01699 TaxID=2975984 RepID=UPI002E2D3FB0|nr:hypothetical protein [Micromonospora sp. NBC_01699]
MQDWADGDLAVEFEQRLDALLADLHPGWQPAELPEPYRSDQRFCDYHRRNAKRAEVGDVLKARPDAAAAHADRVLAATACDEDVSFNKQLLHPVQDAVGRRTVQRYLISVVDHGLAHKKVCAVRAWYWSQASLVYDSAEALRQNRPTRASQAADDSVADLRGEYRIACLRAFVASEHEPTREWLACGFLLVEEYYPPHLHHLVAQARAVAEVHPSQYKDLLARKHDGTNMAQLRPTDS